MLIPDAAVLLLPCVVGACGLCVTVGRIVGSIFRDIQFGEVGLYWLMWVGAETVSVDECPLTVSFLSARLGV